MDLVKTVANFIKQEKLIPAGSMVLAAVSGGVDSMVLADILHRLRQELRFELAIASFDHGLRAESGADLAFVRSWANEHELPFFGGAGDIAALSGGKNVEDIARRERYAFLRRTGARLGATAIATAHHRGDQAETVLLHLLRGSGVTGLSGMHPARDGLIRPLLCAERRDIAGYAAARGIAFREDSTNSSTQYLRNSIRLELLPSLARYNPGVSRQLNDTAAICRDEDALLDELAQIALAELWSVERSSLSGPGFELLAPALQRRVLRRAYQLLAGERRELSYRQVEAIRGLKDEQCCDLPLGFKAWRRGDLCFGPQMPPLSAVEKEWSLCLDGAWHELAELECSYCALRLGEDAQAEQGEKHWLLLSQDRVKSALWRTRRPGDYMPSRSGRGRRKVKDIFIEHQIPGYLRVKWPLLVSAAGETLWLPGLRALPPAAGPNNILIKVRLSDKINSMLGLC